MGRVSFRWSFALLFTFIACVFLSAESNAEKKHPDKHYIAPMQAADILVSGKERVFLLDVRFDWEYNDYHIPGAKNIPVQVLNKQENLAKVPRNRKVILYCRTGVRAEQALGILLSKGYDAYTIDGGIAAWWRDIIEPPSITSAPFGKQADLFRKRQGLRNYFMNIPGAGSARAFPRGPAIPKKSAESKTPKSQASSPAPKKETPKADIQPCAVGPPALENPCG